MRMMAVVAAAGAAVAFTVSGCGSHGSPGEPGSPAKPGASAGAKPGDLTGTTWKLLTIESMAEPNEEPSLTIPDPSKFTVTFGDDGRAGFLINCNRGNSTWKVEGAGPESGSLTFGPIAVTRMMCPSPDYDAKVAAALGQVRSYLLGDDDTLHLSMEADSGVMHFKLTKPS
jgi:heat shock protein HslJ